MVFIRIAGVPKVFSHRDTEDTEAARTGVRKTLCLCASVVIFSHHGGHGGSEYHGCSRFSEYWDKCTGANLRPCRFGWTFFMGKDVAEALGYTAPQNALAAHVDDEDKTTTLIQGTGSKIKANSGAIRIHVDNEDKGGGRNGPLLVESKSGLYQRVGGGEDRPAADKVNLQRKNYSTAPPLGWGWGWVTLFPNS
ncbi:MAG: Bro-N domain-containing protein [Prevotella sp.]|nr:Bro-N domain-containing protein [Prevotella sp.]